MEATVITSESAQEFYSDRLPQVTPKADEATKVEADDAGKQERKPKPVQPRINELVAERNEAQELALSEAQRAEELRREVDDLRKKIEVLQTPAQPMEVKERPQRETFATQEEYEDAVTDWKVEKRLAEREQQEREARIKAAREQLANNWKTRQDVFRAEATDYDEALNGSEVDMPQYMLDAIMESDAGPTVAYHLAKNQDVARKLVGMTPTAALRELGKLEDRLSKSKSEKTEIEPKKAAVAAVEISKAPAPIETLKKASSPVEKDPKDMSFAEFKAWRKASSKR